VGCKARDLIRRAPDFIEIATIITVAAIDESRPKCHASDKPPLSGGKPCYVDVFTLSSDGKTLTDDGNPVAAKEPVKAVYERQ